jgi:hypothetical protein
LNQSQQKLKINLFGELWKLSKIKLKKTEFEALKTFSSKFKISKSEALLDVNFYTFLRTRGISFYEDFENTSKKGLVNNGKSQIEVWFANKKVKKINLSNLNNENLLFPLFNIQKSSLDYSNLQAGMYVEQKEIGLIASYEMFLAKFDINNLSYHFVEVINAEKKFQMLYEIKYCGEIISKNSKTDSLITYQYSFEI